MAIYNHNIGIQMKRKEPTKLFYDDFNMRTTTEKRSYFYEWVICCWDQKINIGEALIWLRLTLGVEVYSFKFDLSRVRFTWPYYSVALTT